MFRIRSFYTALSWRTESNQLFLHNEHIYGFVTSSNIET